MISAELQKLFENLLNQILNMEHIHMKPLLFVRDDASAESNRRCMERRSVDLYFLYVTLCVLKLIDVVWSID
jgi:hypothetical protein